MSLVLLNSLVGHGREVNAIAFSRDDRLLVSARGDSTVRIWNVAAQKLLQTLEHGEWVSSIAFAPSGHMVASAGRNKEVKIWGLEASKLLATLGAPDQDPITLTFTNDGLRLAVGGLEGVIRIYNLRTRSPEADLESHAGPVRCVRFSSLGDRMLSAGGMAWRGYGGGKPARWPSS